MKRYKYELARNVDKPMATLCLAYGMLGRLNDRPFGQHGDYSLICSGVSLIESKLILTFDEFHDTTYKIVDGKGDVIRMFAWHEVYAVDDYNRFFRPELMECLPDAS